MAGCPLDEPRDVTAVAADPFEHFQHRPISAAVLAAVIQGWAPASLLDSYEPERRPVANRTIDAAADQEAFLAPSFAADELDAHGPLRVPASSRH